MITVPAVKCPKCEHTEEFDRYALQVVEEDALLVCPSCGATFSIIATLETMPDDEEPAGDEDDLDQEPEEEPGEGEEEEEESVVPDAQRLQHPSAAPLCEEKSRARRRAPTKDSGGPDKKKKRLFWGMERMTPAEVMVWSRTINYYQWKLGKSATDAVQMAKEEIKRNLVALRKEFPGSFLPGSDLVNLVGGEKTEAKDSKSQDDVLVLLCSSCKKDWVGLHRTDCPFCGSAQILASTKTHVQKAEEMVDDVARGLLPPSAAIDIMLGRPIGK